MNDGRLVFIVSDNVVSTSNWSNFGMLSRRTGLSATAGHSCFNCLSVVEQKSATDDSGPQECIVKEGENTAEANGTNRASQKLLKLLNMY